jgi:hypothetical protein
MAEQDDPSQGSPDAPPRTPPAGPRPPVAWGAADAPAAPPVAWAAPPSPAPIAGIGSYAGGPPRLTVGALLSDVFARYGADPVRIVALAAGPSLLSLLSTLLFNPALGPSRSVGFVPLVSLVLVVVSLVSAAATLALLDGGPSVPLAKAISRGFQRSGWLVLAAILMVLAFLVVGIVLLLVFGIFVGVLFFATRAFAVVFILYLLFLPTILWLFIRVALSLAAVVVDNLNAIDGITLSWRITRRWGVSLRILAAELLLFLLLVPAAIGSSLLQLTGFGPGALISLVVLAVVSPLGSILIYSAYRRLVPPFWPPWVGIPAATIDASGVETIPPPAFTVPPFGGVAQGILIALIVLAAIGLVLGAVAFGQLLSGAIHFQPGQPMYPGGPTFPPFPSFAPFPTLPPQ